MAIDKPSKIKVVIQGRYVEVPADEPIVYLAEVFSPNIASVPSRVCVSSDREFTWTFVREAITSGGYGHVLAYDVTLPNRPTRLRCLGRIDTPTQEPVIP
jgi:hypothetical protein